MDYPNFLSIKVLDAQHSKYVKLNDVWQTVDDLIEGGHRINSKVEKYLKMIPGETIEVYQKRKELFTYHPVLGECVAEIKRKFLTGSLSVFGLPKSEQSIFHAFWEAFRDETESDRNSEILLASEIFENLLTYGRVYIHLEQDGKSSNNLAADIANGIIPYVNVYHPSTVINWGKDWYKLKIIEEVNDPFIQSPLHKITWVFIDSEQTAIYTSIGELDDKNCLTKILVNNQLEPVDPEQYKVALESLEVHGYSQNPIIKHVLPAGEWITDKAHLRALEHLRELNSKHSMNTMLYIQRTFKPRIDSQDSMEFISEEVQSSIESGNPYILDVDGFSFNEPSGTASNTLKESLTDIKDAMRGLYGLNPGETSKGGLERSGASKEMDFITVRDILLSFGTIITPLLNTIYWMVSENVGYIEEINVSGLSNFQVNVLSSDIENGLKIQEIETQVAPTALEIFYSRLSLELAGSTTPEQKQDIENEVRNIFKAPTIMLKDIQNDTEE